MILSVLDVPLCFFVFLFLGGFSYWLLFFVFFTFVNSGICLTDMHSCHEIPPMLDFSHVFRYHGAETAVKKRQKKKPQKAVEPVDLYDKPQLHRNVRSMEEVRDLTMLGSMYTIGRQGRGRKRR